MKNILFLAATLAIALSGSAKDSSAQEPLRALGFTPQELIFILAA